MRDLAGREHNIGMINGKPITPEQYRHAYNEMQIFVRLRFQEWPKSDEMLKAMGFDVERETLMRLLLVEKMKAMKIEASPDATAKVLSQIFRAEDGRSFPIEEYNSFVKTQLEPRGLTKADLERFAAHEAGQQQLIAIAGISGRMVTEDEARYLYQRENESMLVDAVFFSATNYLPEVKVTGDAVARYFSLNKAKYHVADKVQVEFVKYDLTNFFAKADEELAKMTNFNLVVERTYFERGATNYYKDEKGRGLTLEEAKPKIKDEIRKYYSANEAKKVALNFTTALFEYAEKNPGDKGAFAKVAAEQKLTVTQTPPFDERTGLKDSKIPPAFRTAAFRLNEESPYTSSPVIGEDAAYVLGLKAKIPGFYPELSAVTNEVTADFKQAEALRIARKAGDDFSAAAAKELKEGKKFDSICIEHKVRPVSLPAFSVTTRSMPEISDRLELTSLQNAWGRLSPQQCSDLVGTADGGAVIYLRERKAVDPEKMAKQLPDYLNQLRDQRQYAAYREWLEKLPRELNFVQPGAPPVKNKS